MDLGRGLMAIFNVGSSFINFCLPFLGTLTRLFSRASNRAVQETE